MKLEFQSILMVENSVSNKLDFLVKINAHQLLSVISELHLKSIKCWTPVC